MNVGLISSAERAAAGATLLAGPKVQGFPPAQLALILAACQWRRIPAGARPFSAGDETSSVQAVAAGYVAFESSLAIPDLPLVNFLAPPFWFLGRPHVHGRIRMNTATARTPLLIAQLSQARFDALAVEQPAIQDFKAWVTGALFWEVLEALTDALIPNNRHRVVSTLLRVAACKHGGDAPVSLPITQAELAAITNLSRQTCGALLRAFESSALIRLGYGEIELLAPARLRALIT